MNDSEAKAIWKVLSELKQHYAIRVDEDRRIGKRIDDLEAFIMKVAYNLNDLTQEINAAKT